MNYKLRIEVIKEIYNRYNLSKQQDVPDLLKKYAGSEDKLLDSICSKYNVNSYELSSIVMVCEERISITQKRNRKLYVLGFLSLSVVTTAVLCIFSINSKCTVQNINNDDGNTVDNVIDSKGSYLKESIENEYYEIRLPHQFKCVEQEFHSSSTYTDGEIMINQYPWGHDGVDKEDLVSLIENNLETISLKKTKDGLFWGSGRTSDGFYRYVVILPNELFEFQVYSKTNGNGFSEFSQWLLNNVREGAKSKKNILLTDWSGETCYNTEKE